MKLNGFRIELGDITAQLKLPVSPFVYAMGLLCGVTAAVHAVHALRPGRDAAAGAGAGPAA